MRTLTLLCLPCNFTGNVTQEQSEWCFKYHLCLVCESTWPCSVRHSDRPSTMDRPPGTICRLCLKKKSHKGEIIRLFRFHKMVHSRIQIRPSLVTTELHAWPLIPCWSSQTRPADPWKGCIKATRTGIESRLTRFAICSPGAGSP